MTKPSPELAALFEPVLEWLDKGGDEQYGFNMSQFYQGEGMGSTKNPDHDGNICGTTLCIAGAVGSFNEHMDFSGTQAHGQEGAILERALFANDALVANYGMSEEDNYKLFFNTKSDTKPSHAAAVIRHWIETGEVDWEGIADG